MTVGGLEVAREDGETRQVTVELSRLAFDGLQSGGDAPPPVQLESALRCYLGDRDAGRPAWPYPGFLRGSEVPREQSVELGDADLWRELEEEAERQGVSVEQLAEHAAFYFAAELDAGRVTQRILDDLDSGEGSG
jgi:hypothetical protein